MPKDRLIFLVEDDAVAATLMARWLDHDGLPAQVFHRAEPALEALDRETPACLVLDLGLPGMSGMEALQRVRASHPALPVVIVTARGDVDTVVQAMREGADDYLQKPLEATRFLGVVRRALVPDAAARRLPRRTPASAVGVARPIIGDGAAIRELLAQIQKVAATDVSVHISGESGSGKELVARGIHVASRRAPGPFVAVNCGAISETLQDSELFGHERGSFTGAAGRRRGVFEQAQGGTVFLDEVAELSPATQVRLLRVLQDHEVVRVGGEVSVPVDVRVISATNKELAEEQRAGRFREDLFYRLVVYPIRVPPLRDRVEDIPALVAHFIAQAGSATGCTDAPITEAALARLQGFPWPGNVRELENAVRLALVNAGCATIEVEHLPPRVQAASPFQPQGPGEAPSAPEDAGPPPEPEGGGGDGALVFGDAPDSVLIGGGGVNGGRLEDAEREVILAALVATEGRVVAAARRLGMSRATLYRRLEQYGITASEFRQATERLVDVDDD